MRRALIGETFWGGISGAQIFENLKFTSKLIYSLLLLTDNSILLDNVAVKPSELFFEYEEALFSVHKGVMESRGASCEGKCFRLPALADTAVFMAVTTRIK